MTPIDRTKSATLNLRCPKGIALDQTPLIPFVGPKNDQTVKKKTIRILAKIEFIRIFFYGDEAPKPPHPPPPAQKRLEGKSVKCRGGWIKN